MASAAAAVLVLLNRTASATNMIALTLEIIGMAGCAERLVPIERPYKGAVDAAAMAGTASRVSSVVTRVVAPGAVTEDIRRPGIG